MLQSVAQARRWLVAAALVLLAVVGVAYYIGQHRERPVLHNIPQQLGVDIQQTSEGFSLSKSEGGRTLYTIRASKAVQFKKGGKAELNNVHVTVYGRTHDRYDQIYGEKFIYDQQSGDITGPGEVHIDLQGYEEGPQRPDQAPPDELKNPIHLKTTGLTFNQKTGIGQTNEEVEFKSAQVSGTAKGAYYDSKNNQLQLKSDVHMVTTGENAAVITGTGGFIQKEPRQAVLVNARIEQPDRTFWADKVTMLFEPDNTVRHALAEGNVRIESRGPTVVDINAPRGDLNMGQDNAVQQAIVTGGATFVTRGDNLTHGSAETFILDFGLDNQPARFHMVKNARMHQDPNPAKKTANGGGGQPMEIAADALDFLLEDGNALKTVETVGKAHITILPNPSGDKKASAKADQSMGNATTVATAGKFHALFGEGNKIQSLHGSPEAKIVSTSPGQPDKVSTSDKLDVAFAADGGVQKLVQTGNFQYHEPSATPGTNGRSAFAEVATYTPSDQKLLLNGSPRVIDGGMTVTADVVRMDRQGGEAFADGNVKTTYSDLKPQPDGALLAASDPIHVTAAHMNSRQQPGIAHYTGNVRLWQGANVVRAPKMDFDQSQRTILAQSEPSQPVSSLFVQQSADGKTTPVDVTADKLTYIDSERRARYSGHVFAKSADSTINAQQIDIYLKQTAANGKTQTASKNAGAASVLPGAEGPSQIDRIVAEGKVLITEPNRRAVGDKLVYTADDAKYVLTGKSPSIFDATHGTVWGDSLTFYSRDDRVLVESKRSTPTFTRARIAK